MTREDEVLRKICEDGSYRIGIFSNTYESELNTLMSHGLIDKSSTGMAHYIYAPTEKGKTIYTSGGFTKYITSLTNEDIEKELRAELLRLGIYSVRNVIDSAEECKRRARWSLVFVAIAALVQVAQYVCPFQQLWTYFLKMIELCKLL